MRNEEDEARDWQGEELTCVGCQYEALMQEGKCQLKQACVFDRYMRRIDRFFYWNPTLANNHLRDPYFETRAVAAKHADVFRLPSLLEDEDETVRWAAAARLPHNYLLKLINDPHREVRIRVASHLDDGNLVSMIHDPDYYVRTMVARRLTPATLPLMINDPEPEVRRTIVRRIDAGWLMRLSQDADPSVRLEVVQRLSNEQLVTLRSDPDWRIRYEVASRIDDVAGLNELTIDEDSMVREQAIERLKQLQAGQSGSEARIS